MSVAAPVMDSRLRGNDWDRRVMRPTLDAFADAAVRRAVPFVPFGRDWEGWDCWGVIWRAYQEVFGVTLPSYSHLYDRADDWAVTDALIVAALPQWRALPAAVAGAVVVFKIGGKRCHVGLVTRPPRMLHVLRGIASCIERYDGAIWGKRVDGCYVPAGR